MLDAYSVIQKLFSSAVIQSVIFGTDLSERSPQEERLVTLLDGLFGPEEFNSVADFQVKLQTAVIEKGEDNFRKHVQAILQEAEVEHESLAGWANERRLNVNGKGAGKKDLEKGEIIERLKQACFRVYDTMRSVKAHPTNLAYAFEFKRQVADMRVSILEAFSHLGKPGEFPSGHGETTVWGREWRASLQDAPKAELAQYEKFDMANIWNTEDGIYVSDLVSGLREVNAYEIWMTDFEARTAVAEKRKKNKPNDDKSRIPISIPKIVLTVEEKRANRKLFLDELEIARYTMFGAIALVKENPGKVEYAQVFQNQVARRRGFIYEELASLAKPGEFPLGGRAKSEHEVKWRNSLEDAPKEELAQYTRFDMTKIWETEDGEYVGALISALRETNAYETLVNKLRGMTEEGDEQKKVQGKPPTIVENDSVEKENVGITEAERIASRIVVIDKLKDARIAIAKASGMIKMNPLDPTYVDELQIQIISTRSYVHDELLRLGKPGEFPLGQGGNDEAEKQWISTQRNAPEEDLEEYYSFDMSHIWRTEDGAYVTPLLTVLQELNAQEAWMVDYLGTPNYDQKDSSASEEEDDKFAR